MLYIPGRFRRRRTQTLTQPPHLRELTRQQPRHLRLERPRVHDLSQRRIRRQRQQIPRHIKRPRLQRPLIRLLLHRLRLRDGRGQRPRHALAHLVIAAKQQLYRLPEQPRLPRQIGRVPPRPPKILVPRRALLPIPALLVLKHNRRQQAQPLHRHRDVRQIRNRPMPILKVERVQELLSLLRADLFQRLAQGQRRPRILRHRIRQHFGVCAMNRIDLRLVLLPVFATHPVLSVS